LEQSERQVVKIGTFTVTSLNVAEIMALGEKERGKRLYETFISLFPEGSKIEDYQFLTDANESNICIRPNEGVFRMRNCDHCGNPIFSEKNWADHQSCRKDRQRHNDAKKNIERNWP
jgi:hypothetical protein